MQISVSVSRFFVNGSGEWYITSVTLIANFTRYQNVKKKERGVSFVFHGKLNTRTDRVKLKMKCGDVFFVENAECVVYISQPQRKWSVKSSNGSVLDMFHVGLNVSDDGGDARTHGSTKDLLVRRVFVRKDTRIQADF